MFTRIALRSRILPPTRQLLLLRRLASLQPRFQLPGPRLFTSGHYKLNAVTPEKSKTNNPSEFTPPPYCPGCGAPSQQIDDSLPGFYHTKLSQAQRFGPEKKIKTAQKKYEDDVYEQALARIKAEMESMAENPETEDMGPALEMKSHREDLGGLAEAAAQIEDLKAPPPPPVCVRCHMMVHHHRAPPLPSYPTLDTLTTLLVASKHKQHHIYHLLDASDLPMSLFPGLVSHLWTTLPREIMKQLTVSYVVTRCDLLMPTNDQVGSLMMWMKKVVKDCLPEREKIGNVQDNTRFHVVSAKMGWGIGRLKLEARSREGGVWVLGAVNVGKSRLVKELWPETGRSKMGTLEEAQEFDILPEILELEDPAAGEGGELKGIEPLQPPQRKENRPPLTPQVPPTVSDIPGTTAAPIRITYKTTGKRAFGELIDLPGLERWVGFGAHGLLQFVRDDKKKEFIMKDKVRPKQYTIRPGQSLLIAGLIMITPKITLEDNLVILAYPFIPLPIHITSTQKALNFLSDRDPESHPRIGLFQKPPPDEPLIGPSDPEPTEDTDPKISPHSTFIHHIDIHPTPDTLPPHFASAGTFSLCDDVTTFRHDHLPSKHPNFVEGLPYRIVATDIVLSGIGWVELVAQVRRKKEKEGLKVEVEVFTPEGKGIGQRTTMRADTIRKKGAMMAGVGVKKVVRQRKSMKGDKKRKKAAARKISAEGGMSDDRV